MGFLHVLSLRSTIKHVTFLPFWACGNRLCDNPIGIQSNTWKCRKSSKKVTYLMILPRIAFWGQKWPQNWLFDPFWGPKWQSGAKNAKSHISGGTFGRTPKRPQPIRDWLKKPKKGSKMAIRDPKKTPQPVGKVTLPPRLRPGPPWKGTFALWGSDWTPPLPPLGLQSDCNSGSKSHFLTIFTTFSPFLTSFDHFSVFGGKSQFWGSKWLWIVSIMVQLMFSDYGTTHSIV